MIDFSRAKLLTFDCYGTLIDWETGILRFFRALLPRTVTEAQILGLYAKHEAEIEAEAYRPYREVLGEVVRRLGREIGRAMGPGDSKQFARDAGSWLPFAETPGVLRDLKARFKLGVISNIDREIFAATREKLGVELDLLVTAEDVRAYKPSEAPFRRALELARKLGVEAGEIVHIAESRYHDVAPARALGLKTVWVNRRPGKVSATPAVDASPDLEVRSLRELGRATGPAP